MFLKCTAQLCQYGRADSGARRAFHDYFTEMLRPGVTAGTWHNRKMKVISCSCYSVYHKPAFSITYPRVNRSTRKLQKNACASEGCTNASHLTSKSTQNVPENINKRRWGLELGQVYLVAMDTAASRESREIKKKRRNNSWFFLKNIVQIFITSSFLTKSLSLVTFVLFAPFL